MAMSSQTQPPILFHEVYGLGFKLFNLIIVTSIQAKKHPEAMPWMEKSNETSIIH